LGQLKQPHSNLGRDRNILNQEHLAILVARYCPALAREEQILAIRKTVLEE